MIKGVIFDMDGLMLDTERLYVEYWVKAGRFLGYNMSREHALAIRSMSAKYAIEKFIEFFGKDCYYEIRTKRIEMMNEYLETHIIEKKKGLDELLIFLKEHNICTSVATATDEERTRKYLTKLNLIKYFDKIVCAQMVTNGKPAPDIYIEAAKRLKLKPSECIALEDSPNGILSAYRAGCKPIMIPDLDKPDEETKKMLYACEEDLTKVMKYIMEV